ncbi:MAG: GatB/YqeY domain-containing protein, partial [Candidatus Lokiarchaeota archaeon]|nr:GatB/YqeY domain-containing protein [Candidatus Lokiarchaeota archaeon]
LKNYKFSEESIKNIKKKLKIEENDCFVLLLGSKQEIEKAMDVIINRVKYAFKGVPPETRRALENGNTEFLRELHGGARLYPDTDSPAIINTEKEIDKIRKNLPKYPWVTIKEYSKKYEVEDRMIKDLIFNGKLSLFNELIEIFPDNPLIILTTLLETTTALRRDGKEVENITDVDYKEIFKDLKNKRIGKEAIEDIMIIKADFPDLTIEQVKEKLSIESISIDDLKKVIEEIVNKNIDLLKKREMRAIGPLMGEVMKKVRGKIDGAIVSKELKNSITKKLEEM